MGLLYEAAIFLVAAVIAVPLFQKLGLGAVLGYLAAGVIIGPSGFGLITDVDDILQFAKIGVILLLFIVGLELTPHRLWVLRHSIFGLGLIKVLACAIPIGAAAHGIFDLGLAASLVIGLGLAFSSTAFAMQALAERNELSSPHGRGAFAILLFKYIALLPLLASLPLLGGETTLTTGEVALGTLQTVAVLVAIIAGGHYLLRPIFRAVARAGAPETFTATALLVVLGTSIVVEQAGLPMALGAFLAGVLLADSEYRHEIHVNIKPFKGLLLGLFFIAVGMYADLRLIAEVPGTILGITTSVIALKLVMIYAVSRLWGMTPHSSRALASLLPQGGELAFVLFSTATVYGIMESMVADVLIAVVTLSMAATPLIIFVTRQILEPRLGGNEAAERPYDTVDTEHPGVIIAGFGRFGQMVGRLLHSAHIPFAALDKNPMQVDFIRRYGHRIYYGDVSRVDLLKAAEASHARALVLAIDDIEASVRTAEHVRAHFPDLPIYARARTRQHAWRLMDLGCAVIVRETVAASLGLGEQLLRGFGWDPAQARDAIEHFRQHDEDMLQRYYAIHQERDTLHQTLQEVVDELEGLFEIEDRDPVDGRYRGQVPR